MKVMKRLKTNLAHSNAIVSVCTALLTKSVEPFLSSAI